MIAQSIATANGIEYMTSNSTLGLSQIKAKLVLNANADRAMTEVLAKVQQVKYRMPTGVFDPVITKITDGASGGAVHRLHQRDAEPCRRSPISPLRVRHSRC